MTSTVNFETALDVLADQINETLSAHDDDAVWVLLQTNSFSAGALGMVKNPMVAVLIASLAEGVAQHTQHGDGADILEMVVEQYRIAKATDPESPINALRNLTAELIKNRMQTEDEDV